MKATRTFQLVFMAMLSAIAVVLMILVRIPLIPATPFLIYDMADVPVLIGTMLGGIIPGLLILFVTSAIQAFVLGGDYWVGFIMHFVSSGVLVVVTGLFHTCNPKWWKTILGFLIGSLAMTAVMIPMNLVLTPLFMGAPREAVVALLLPAIIPFNVFKSALNCSITLAVYRLLTPFTGKNLLRFSSC
ncbi:MAG TPA: ECF transporter S component [Ruminococcaceae bacterium]|nr:ECF transporter S component [Oscillospiraceae bacterium]